MSRNFFLTLPREDLLCYSSAKAGTGNKKKITRRTTGAQGYKFELFQSIFYLYRTIFSVYLCLSWFISYLGLFWTILVYLCPSWSISDYLGLSWTILVYLGPSWSISVYLGLSGTIWDYLGLFGTIWDYLALSGTIWYYLVLSDTIWDYMGLGCK